MIDLNNLPDSTIRRYCGVPLDGGDGVVVGCTGEPIGMLTIEDDDEVIEIEVCAFHAGVDKPAESVVD
jgi:hypothetical protein